MAQMKGTINLVLPRRGRGGQSAAAIERYEAELKAFAEGILEINSRLDFRVSSRGWCYVLENEAGLSKGDFDKAQDVINECRKKGLLPLDICAEDNAREFDAVEQVHEWGPRRHARLLLINVEKAFQRYTSISFWQAQEYYIQMVVEKVDLKSLFAPIYNEFRIPTANGKGWSDLNMRGEMMERYKAWEAQGKRTVLLYCGDHDPVGLQISDILRDNMAELSEQVGWYPDNLIIDRFGLNFDFIERQGLTWIDGLKTGSNKDLADPKHPDHIKKHVQDYIRQYGARKVEANALVVRPEAGRALLRETIHRYLPADAPARYEATLRPRRQRVRVEFRRLVKNF
jgi:hypothetical protein